MSANIETLRLAMSRLAEDWSQPSGNVSLSSADFETVALKWQTRKLNRQFDFLRPEIVTRTFKGFAFAAAVDFIDEGLKDKDLSKIRDAEKELRLCLGQEKLAVESGRSD